MRFSLMIGVGLLSFLSVAALLVTTHSGRATEVANYLFWYLITISVIGLISHGKVDK